jgi:HEAT repeat protein
VAAIALLGIRPEATAAIPALAELLRDKDKRVRWAAAEALGSMGPAARTAVPALTELLRDEDRPVRQAAAEALKKIKNEKQ